MTNLNERLFAVPGNRNNPNTRLPSSLNRSAQRFENSLPIVFLKDCYYFAPCITQSQRGLNWKFGLNIYFMPRLNSKCIRRYLVLKLLK